MIRDYDHLFKVVIVGSSAVGKSALLRRFADDTFQQSYLATIGVDFRFKTITVNGRIVKLQIWDTAGQQQFRTISSTYYRGAHGILMVYDITNEQSYQDINEFWFKQIEKYAEPNVQLALVGNKSDCLNKKITIQQVKNYVNNKNIPFYEVSAKTGQGVERVFQDMSHILIKLHPKVHNSSNKNSILDDIKQRKNQFKIRTGASSVQKKKDGCC